MNIAGYKKSVSIIQWVQLVLVAFYVPWRTVVVLYLNGIENGMAWIAAETLVYLN